MTAMKFDLGTILYSYLSDFKEREQKISVSPFWLVREKNRVCIIFCFCQLCRTLKNIHETFNIF